MADRQSARKPQEGPGMLGLPEGACVPLPLRRGRGGVVSFDDRGFQHSDRLWTKPAVPAPDEAAMASEEDPGDDESGQKGWVLLEFIEFCFRDGKPGDWKAAGRKLAALAEAVRPGMAIRYEGVARSPGRALGCGLGELGCVCTAEGSELAGRLIEWLFAPRLGARRLKDATARIYLLARTLRPDVLQVTGEDGRAREMTFDDFGLAFGEPPGGRARWHYRAKIFLQGLPQASWQRGEATRERCREAAIGNHNRKGRTKKKNI